MILMRNVFFGVRNEGFLVNGGWFSPLNTRERPAVSQT
jgi:hypothetical protein